MFTGIIEELGRVRSVERRGEGVRMRVEARVVTEGTGEGDSIAVNGVCLTALEVSADGRLARDFAAFDSGEFARRLRR
jgi:riboflavin synthase